MRQETNTCEAFEVLKKYIIENCKGKLASGGKEIRKRCHICGDSRDLTDMHMYIGMKNGSIVYNCFKCGGGYVDAKFLRDIGCYDTNIINLVLAQNRSSNSSNSSRMNRSRIYIQNPDFSVRDNEVTERKLMYLSNRLKHQFTIEECRRLGIILNIGDFLNYNHINRYTRSNDGMICLDKYFVGFLSVDHSYIILRKTVDIEFPNLPHLNERYTNYNIFNKDNGKRLYIIPTLIDPYTVTPIRVNLGEGAITILGVYFNTDAGIIRNSIFIACCGKSYETAVNYLMEDIGIINLDLHVYPDDNVSDNSLRYKLDQYLSIYKSVTIHRNILADDFGVPKSQISEQVYQMSK